MEEGEANDWAYDRVMWLTEYNFAVRADRLLQRDRFVKDFLGTRDPAQSDRVSFDGHMRAFFGASLSPNLRSALFLAYDRRQIRINRKRRRGRKRRAQKP